MTKSFKLSLKISRSDGDNTSKSEWDIRIGEDLSIEVYQCLLSVGILQEN
jgi:hypothetical protein